MVARSASTAARKTSSQTAQADQQIITGTVARRKFMDATKNYYILAVRLENGETITCKGYLSALREGDTYQFSGNYGVTHPTYGKQFIFSTAELLLPTGTFGVARYLADVVSGVGSAKARRIVEVLGDNCLDKIKSDVSVLNQLDFLTPDQREQIAADLSKNSTQAELAGLICREGTGMGTVLKIMNKYGKDSVRIVKENPYILADELWGVGFIKADDIAQTVGIAPNSPHRIEAALNYTLNEAGSEGHVFLQPNDIRDRLLGCNKRGKHVGGLLEGSGVSIIPDIKDANARLIDSGRCVREGDAIYSKSLYVAECSVANSIVHLLNQKIELNANLDAMIDDVQNKVM